MLKRRFFQIHLSTAVVLMFVAGVLVWANVREQRSIIYNPPDPFTGAPRPQFMIVGRGWPNSINSDGPINVPFVGDDSNELPYRWNIPISTARVAFNALFALAILLSVCVACEWRIRRRTVPLQKSP